jgi:exopolysaccharide production protein ExoZ
VYLGVQYLRGIAASAIVLKHASYPGGTLQVMLDAGVDLFFVISGFVMVVSTHNREMTPGEFIDKRARRILPMWWLTLCVVLLLGIGQGDLGPLGSALAFVLIPISSLDVHGNLRPNVEWGVGWTLVFEALFYAIFAVGLARKSRRLIFIVIPGLVAAGLIFGRGDNPVLNVMLHPLLLEFLMGVALARMSLAGIRPTIWWAPVGLLLLAVGASFGLNDDTRALALGVPAAMILAAFASRPLPEIKSLRLLGDATYSIYLVHFATLILAWQIIPKASYWPLTATAAVATGILAYLYVERPMLEAMRRISLRPLLAR